MRTSLRLLDLPVDVLDSILEFLQKTSLSDLKSCSLVCQSWLPSSRRLLYHSTSLKSPRSCTNLYALVCNTPLIAPLIRELHITDYQTPPTRWVANEASLPPLLDALPRLWALFITYQDWERYPLTLKQALCRAVCKRREAHVEGVLSLSTNLLRWETAPALVDAQRLKSLHFGVRQRDVLTLLGSALDGVEHLHIDARLIQCASPPFTLHPFSLSHSGQMERIRCAWMR
jgi:hypothetical protein